MPQDKPRTEDQGRQEQIARLVRRFQEQLEKSLPQDPALTLDEMEKLAQHIGEQVKREVQKDLLESQGTGYCGGETFCPCG